MPQLLQKTRHLYKYCSCLFVSRSLSVSHARSPPRRHYSVYKLCAWCVIALSGLVGSMNVCLTVMILYMIMSGTAFLLSLQIGKSTHDTCINEIDLSFAGAMIVKWHQVVKLTTSADIVRLPKVQEFDKCCGDNCCYVSKTLWFKHAGHSALLLCFFSLLSCFHFLDYCSQQRWTSACDHFYWVII